MRAGAYRVIYALVDSGRVHVVHGLKKSTQGTPLRSPELARRRLEGAR